MLLDGPGAGEAVPECDLSASMAGRPIEHVKVIMLGDFGSVADVRMDFLMAELEIRTLFCRFVRSMGRCSTISNRNRADRWKMCLAKGWFCT